MTTPSHMNLGLFLGLSEDLMVAPQKYYDKQVFLIDIMAMRITPNSGRVFRTQDGPSVGAISVIVMDKEEARRCAAEEDAASWSGKSVWTASIEEITAMTEWFYRATPSSTSILPTVDLLDAGFLVRTVHRATGATIANVRHVAVGDILHVVFVERGLSTFLGSFRVLDPSHPNLEPPVVVQQRTLALAPVRPGSKLAGEISNAGGGGAGYAPDPVLGRHTVFQLEELLPALQTVPPLPRHRNALWRRAAVGSAAAVVQQDRVSERPDAVRPVEWKADSALGLDWSGSKSAGRKIWAAQLRRDGRRYRLVSLQRPFAGAASPNAVLHAFAGWLTAQTFDVAGFDFCFGLPSAQLRYVPGVQAQASGTDPILLGSALGHGFSDADCFRASLAPERKRRTDTVAKAPFAPTNLRMFRQTWLGLRCLGTLARGRYAIPPSQVPGSIPAIVEVLPATVARQLGVAGYKGRSASARAGRRDLVRATRARIDIDASDAATLEGDVEGDAVDSVLAAWAALDGHASGFKVRAQDRAAALVEGWIWT